MDRLTLGFIALCDAAPLVVAKERGLFAYEGLDVTLSRQASWSNIRDRVSVGALDGAHMVAPMPLAASLGRSPLDRPMVTALVLSQGGNGITVSTDLYRRLAEADPVGMAARPPTAEGLRRLVAADRAAGRPKLTFAVVFAHSSHAYELRYWMAAGGVDPEMDVTITVVPPAQMVAHLAAGHVDGFCVGEPWNSLAVDRGVGRILATSPELWRGRSEKVLGLRRDFAEARPDTHAALVRALVRAGQWLDDQNNRSAAAKMLCHPGYLDVPCDIIARSLTGRMAYAQGEVARRLPDLFMFHRHAATFPWVSQAQWYLTQMIRWGQADPATDIAAVASSVYRPDLYRAAVSGMDNVPVPVADTKQEGAQGAPWMLDTAQGPLPMPPDRFFAGPSFDPADPRAYLRGFTISHPRAPRLTIVGRA